MIQADEKDDDYMPGCLMLLHQIRTSSKNEERDKIKQMVRFGQQIISTIPQQNKKKSLEIVFNSLLSFIDASA
jgi:starvation-inducible outer membrane lipoprotein